MGLRASLISSGCHRERHFGGSGEAEYEGTKRRVLRFACVFFVFSALDSAFPEPPKWRSLWQPREIREAMVDRLANPIVTRGFKKMLCVCHTQTRQPPNNQITLLGDDAKKCPPVTPTLCSAAQHHGVCAMKSDTGVCTSSIRRQFARFRSILI